MAELQQLEFIQVFEKNFSRKCEMTVDSTSDKSELSFLTFWCQSPLEFKFFKIITCKNIFLNPLLVIFGILFCRSSVKFTLWWLLRM
jgi:hypothetical protein